MECNARCLRVAIYCSFGVTKVNKDQEMEIKKKKRKEGGVEAMR